MNKSKLLVVGDNCFDITVKGNFEFEEDRNFTPNEYKTTPAGTGVNFAVAFSCFSGSANYFSPISQDSFGQEIENLFKEKNINVYSKKTKKKTALIVAIINEIGERTTFAMLKDTSYTDINVKDFENIADKFDALYISGGICTTQKIQRDIIKISESALKRKMQIFFDPQIRIGKNIPGFLETAIRIADTSDIVFANKDELEIMDLSQNRFIVDKKGSKGATVFYNSKKFSVNGIKVNATDTSGAGDIFNAAFLSCYLDKRPLIETLKFANYAAALSVTKKGVYTPSRKEVNNFINRLKNER